jgi:hypothetical protein
MSQKNKEIQQEKYLIKKQMEKIKYQEKMKLIRENKKKKFNKLLKEEQIKEKELKRKEKEIFEKTMYIEFPYLEELNETEYSELKDNDNWAVCDPGKRVLLYLKNKQGDCLRYTKNTHLKKTKRLKYQKHIQNYKDNKKISEIEKELTSYNSKSCDYNEFKKYIKKKNSVNKKLLNEYKKDIFRQYKWYGYINRKKAETDLIRDIKNKFGKDVTIIYGDWSMGKQMKHKISTPNLGLKRKLKEYFKIYNIDEFRTSCLNHKTLNKCENLYLPFVIYTMQSIVYI